MAVVVVGHVSLLFETLNPRDGSAVGVRGRDTARPKHSEMFMPNLQ